ncbi:Serine/threonine protein kinase PrkC, regulator of stationary phase [hydrothermal vent metagenome]|uniref:Serine/threonine protein kinase PrkC, regulator of stationary phase n=1 Tax=hydrothermal vent metagenome TaxID=652676 RepID=A0A3B1AFX3_9ZZZZ
MSLLHGYKTNKAITTILSSNSASSQTKEAVTRLKNIGPSAIPKLIQALAETDPHSPIENILVSMLTNSSLAAYIEGLADDDKRIISSVMRILGTTDTYDANRLFDLFSDPNIPKNVLVQILIAQKKRLNAKTLIAIIGQVDKSIHQLIFKVLNEIANEKIVPDLIRYSNSKDSTIRTYVAVTLGKFSMPEVRDTLLKMIADPNKKVRQSALDSIAKMQIPVNSKPICNLLKDPDLTVQSKAIDTLVKLNDGNIVKYLIDILQDESEYVRRAAVEVLNEVGNVNAIKDLLNALRDKDWWIKVRAADALGSIGGPKVVEAVLQLIKDKDEFLRRTAVEILNSVNDDRAFKYLVEALEDEDWWVRERAADALASMNDKRAVEPLLKLLNQKGESTQVAIKALTQLKDTRAIKPLISKLQQCDDSTKHDILHALAELTDKHHAEEVEDALTEVMQHPDHDVKTAATKAMQAMQENIGAQPPSAEPQSIGNTSTSTPNTEMLDVAATVVNINPSIPSMPASPSVPSSGASSSPMRSIIDPNELLPGQILDDRYRIIRKIGKGAFGVVVLVEDQMVSENIVLKFLNPQMASDETVIQRFIHELRYARRITHENVIRLYDFITFGKSYAISMEYFDSHSFSFELKSTKSLDKKHGIQIFCDICSGVNAAHRVDVVHRDLKPANILVDDSKLVKVVDFGLAAAASTADSRITKSGILVGTPTYMAPEQVRGRAIDRRTDIYSLGILLYEAFTGKPPYKGEDHMATLFLHVEGKPIPALEKDTSMTQELNDVIMRAMHVDPLKRYQTINELKQDLQNVVIE